MNLPIFWLSWSNGLKQLFRSNHTDLNKVHLVSGYWASSLLPSGMSSAWWYYPESLSKCVWSNAYTPRHPVQHVYLPCLFVAVLASCCAKPPSSHWLKQCPCLHVIGCSQLARCGIHHLCFSLFADTKQTEVGMATFVGLPFIFCPHADAFVPMGAKWINSIWTDVKRD